MNARATCPCSFNAPSTAWRSGLESPHHTRAHAASGTTNRKRGPGRNRCRASEQGVDATIDPAGRTKGRDAFRRGPSRPGRNRTCNPRFWSALLATPALKPLLNFQRVSSKRATPVSLDNAGVDTNPGTGRSSPLHPMSEHFLAAFDQRVRPPEPRARRSIWIRQPLLQPLGLLGDGGSEMGCAGRRVSGSIACPAGGDYAA